MSEANPRGAEGAVSGHRYTQVNINVPSVEVELPPAEKFNAFPGDAQKAILTAFRSEQTERHRWLERQQTNDLHLNHQSQCHNFYLRLLGTIGGVVIVLTMIIAGAWMVVYGASGSGVSLIVTAIAGLAGTAIYGHHVATKKDEPPSREITPQQPATR